MDYGAATLDRIVSSVWRTDDFGRLMGQLERYLPSNDLPSITAAYEFSAKAHQGQQRRNGDPYIWDFGSAAKQETIIVEEDVPLEPLRRPRALPSRLDPETVAAHGKLVLGMGDKAIWNRYQN